MYEELVKRMKESAERFDYDGWVDTAAILEEAADVIEELIPFKKQVEKGIGLLDKADELLKAVKPLWIPVTERLPEPWEPVLVTYLSYNSHLPKADMLAYIDSDDGLWYWWDDTDPSGTKCIVTITHWMPLPDPPKEETK